MIVHIVIFKLFENDSNSIEDFISELEILKKLPFSLKLKVVKKSNIFKSYIEGDVLLYSEFNSKEDLNDYMNNHKHLKVIEDTSSKIQDKYILDFGV
ncbi:Dabb family protein [Aquimarina sp. 2201CG1-2-11]|uniref:Dabb family protein n=1 Tax=Aquimarina discodermiae TaxID=3231043 RepID=UPI0034619AC5